MARSAAIFVFCICACDRQLVIGGACALGGRPGGPDQMMAFAAATTHTIGRGPVAMALADFDGNATLDVAVACATEGTVEILLGTGRGDFNPRLRVAMGLSPSGVAAGDFDADGHMDLAVGTGATGTVRILLGDGRGGFAGAAEASAGGAPTALLAGDLDFDGRVDLVALIDAGTAHQSVALLLAGEALGFTAPMKLAVPEAEGELALGDVNLDGLLDLVVPLRIADEVRLWRGGPDRKLVDKGAFATGKWPAAVVMADFTGDGVVDVATSDNGSASVSVLPGRTRGGFSPPRKTVVAASPAALAVADFNRDGAGDLAVAYTVSARVSVLAGNNDGSFPRAEDYTVSGPPRSIFAADMNCDGRADLLALDEISSQILVLLNESR